MFLLLCWLRRKWTRAGGMTPIIDPLDRERLTRGDRSEKPKAGWHVASKWALIVGAVYGIVLLFSLYRLYRRQLDYPGQSEMIEFAFHYALLTTFPIWACVSFMLPFLFIGGWPMIDRVREAR